MSRPVFYKSAQQHRTSGSAADARMQIWYELIRGGANGFSDIEILLFVMVVNTIAFEDLL